MAIITKHSETTGVVPTAAQLALGELAINTADSKLFAENTSGQVIELSYRDARVKDYLSGGTYNANIIPATNNTYDLGSATKMWRDVYIGPGSLYVNGQKVIQEETVSGDIIITADADQNIRLSTLGSGDIQFDPLGTGSIIIKGPLQIQAGNNISSSDGNAISFTNGVAVDNLTSKTTNADLNLTGNGTGSVRVDDNLIITGNLTVSGTTTTINTETISLADNIIDLNSNFTTGTPSENAGIRIMRGDSSAVQFRWNETTDKWELTTDGSTYNQIPTLASFSVTDSGGDGSLSYNNSTGVFTYTGPSSSEVRAHFSAGTGISITNGAIASTITQYTDALARAAISAGTGISYNSTTGVISVSGGSSGTVTSVGITGSTGISVSGSPITSSGNITVTNTGVTSAVAGTGVSVSSATGAVTFSIGQSVATSAAPTFREVYVSELLCTSKISEKLVTLASGTVNLLNGVWFKYTATSTLNWAFNNPGTADYDVQSFVLELTNGGAYTMNWPSGTKWAGGSAPTLTASGTDILGFYTSDMGTTWYGFVLGKAMA